MSVKKQIPSWSKCYTIYEEVPGSFSDETDVDSYFYHNILDIARIVNRIVRISKGSNRKFLLLNFFSFATWKINKDYFLNRKCQFHWKNLQLFWTLYVSFCYNTIILSNFQIYTSYPDQSKRLVLLSLKTNSLPIISKTLKNLATGRYVFLFVLSVARNVVNPSKSFELLVSKTF